jgi:hypothetical protein
MRSVVRVYLGPSEQGKDSTPVIDKVSHTYSGAVAQLGERRFCKPEVVGSIPISSIAPENGADIFLVIPFPKGDGSTRKVVL